MKKILKRFDYPGTVFIAFRWIIWLLEVLGGFIALILSLHSSEGWAMDSWVVSEWYGKCGYTI